VWTDELTGAVEQENFLLDKGRLKLKTIQQAFSASLVRMCIGISEFYNNKSNCGHITFYYILINGAIFE